MEEPKLLVEFSMILAFNQFTKNADFYQVTLFQQIRSKSVLYKKSPGYGALYEQKWINHQMILVD